MQMHKSEIKAQVGVLVANGEKTETIAKKLGLTFNQVAHIKSYYYNKKRLAERSPQEKAWDKRRANTTTETNINVGVVKPKKENGLPITKKRTFTYGDITFEFEGGVSKRIYFGADGSLTIK